MPNQQIQSHHDSPWNKLCNTLANSWLGRHLGMRSRMEVRVEEPGKNYNIVLYLSPEQRSLLRKALATPVPLRSLGVPSHGALRHPDAADSLVRGLRRLKEKRRKNSGWNVRQNIENSIQFQKDLNEILNDRCPFDSIDTADLIERINKLLHLQEQGLKATKSHLDLLCQKLTNPKEVFDTPRRKREISSKELIKDCRVLTNMIDALPETLELPEGAPLRYLLEGEVTRLTRLIQELKEVPDETQIHEVLEEFVRIEEVLHSDLAASPYLEGQEAALLPFTAKLQQLCRNYSTFYVSEK